MNRIQRLAAARGLVMLALLPGATRALADGPFVFHSITPCRVVDTRNAAGTNAGPALAANALRTFRIQGQCGVPDGAKAVTLNVTVVQPQSAGWLGVYPVTGFSGTSTVNFVAGEFAIANGAIVPLSPVLTGADRDCSAFWGNYSGVNPVAHLLLDVTGYFQP